MAKSTRIAIKEKISQTLNHMQTAGVNLIVIAEEFEIVHPEYTEILNMINQLIIEAHTALEKVDKQV